jgi:hypothetical protein
VCCHAAGRRKKKEGLFKKNSFNKKNSKRGLGINLSVYEEFAVITRQKNSEATTKNPIWML